MTTPNASKCPSCPSAGTSKSDMVQSLDDQDSALNECFGLAYWVTLGRIQHTPKTAREFLERAKQRRQVATASKEWDRHKKDALENAADYPPKPRGKELVDWWKHHQARGTRSSSGLTSD